MADQEKDELKELRQRLMIAPRLVWDEADPVLREAIMAFGEKYKDFLDRAKTERKAVEEI